MRGRLALTLLVAVVAALLTFSLRPDLDLAVERLLRTNGRFLLTGSPLFDWIHGVGLPCAVLLTLTAAGIATVAAFFGRPIPGITVTRGLFVLAVFAVGPGLLVNAVLKDHSGRPRPQQVEEFGGMLAYAAPFAFDGACPRNCSFVAGDPSAMFALMAPACLLPGPWRRRGILGAIGLGAAVGLMRMMQGGHFLSDVIFAGLVVAATTLALHWALFRADGAPKVKPPSWAGRRDRARQN